MEEEKLLKFNDAHFGAFREHKGKFYLGEIEMTPQELDILKRDAEMFLKTRLFEVLNRTIQDESYTMSLVKATEWDHVLSAKMLYHWNFVMVNLLIKLASVDNKK